MDGNSVSDAPSLRQTKASPPVSQLVRLLWREDTAELQMSIAHIPHIAMYLSLKLDSVSSKEEVSFGAVPVPLLSFRCALCDLQLLSVCEWVWLTVVFLV